MGTNLAPQLPASVVMEKNVKSETVQLRTESDKIMKENKEGGVVDGCSSFVTMRNTMQCTV